MTKKVDWLWSVLDYGRRFPDMTCGGLLGTVEDYKISNMIQVDNRICGLGEYIYFRIHSQKGLMYWDVWRYRPVPQYILLRLLTDGKEDLI